MRSRITFLAALLAGALCLHSARAASVNMFSVRLSDGSSFDGSRLLDLHGRDLVINTAPLTRQLAFDWLANLVQQGRAFTDSTLAPSDHAGWVVMVNDNGSGRPILWRFADQIVDASSILVKYAYHGDVNLDGAVNLNDYFTIDSGFLGRATGYANGDVNLDGGINLNDYFLVDSAYLGQRSLSSNRTALTALVSVRSPSLDPTSAPVPSAVWMGGGLLGAMVVARRLGLKSA